MTKPRQSELIRLTDKTFDAAVSGDRATIVVFSATWCRPCLAFEPALGEVAEEVRDHLDVAIADLDAAPMAAMAAMVRAVPTIALYRRGQLVAEYMGAPSAPALRGWIVQSLDSERFV